MTGLRAIASAFGYFSILPVSTRIERTPPTNAIVGALPLVGATLGAIVGVATLLAAHVTPQPLLTLVPIALLWLLSGAIHLDGYLDSCDALFAPVPVKRRLEIFKDPGHGSFAMVGMALLSLGWWSVATLFTRGIQEAWWMLAIACALARLAAIANGWFFSHVRGDDGMHPLRRPPNAVAFTGSALVIAAALWWAFGIVGLAIGGASAVFALGLGRFAAARLDGGLVGDVYGWIVSLLEPVILCALVLSGGSSLR